MPSKEELFKTARAQIVVSDPHIILTSLGIEYETLKNGNQYKFKLRETERTASSYISLYQGEWKYIDFGDSSSSGSIIDIVMRRLNLPFFDSMLYCLQIFGFTDLLEEVTSKETNPEDIRNRIAALKIDKENIMKQNIKKENDKPKSKVTNVYEVSTHKKAIEYLKNRGIIKIPEEFKVIFGEYPKNNSMVSRFGVGVLTERDGADIHFLEPFGSFKTITFGVSEISYFERTENPENAPILIFESKMDYGAAYQVLNFTHSIIIIANSTSNYRKVAEKIKEKELKGRIFFINQNDLAGYNFVVQIAEELGYSEDTIIDYIKYDLEKEYKQDLNDLLLKNINIRNRFSKTSLSTIKSYYQFYEDNKDKFN